MLDRNYNSALNHLQNGLELLHLPVWRGEVTPVETVFTVAEAGTHRTLKGVVADQTINPG